MNRIQLRKRFTNYFILIFLITLSSFEYYNNCYYLQKSNRLAKDNWFDTEVISESLHTLKKYLPVDDIKFFSLPKIHSSQSDSNLSLLK